MRTRPRWWPSGVRHRVGHRGRALLIFALLDLVYCQSLLTPTPRTLASPIYAYLAAIAPLPAWAALWGSVGVICLVSAFRRSDPLAFGCAAFLKTLWGLTLLGGWLTGHVERGYVSAAIWLAVAAWAIDLGRWAEPGEALGERTQRWTRR